MKSALAIALLIALSIAFAIALLFLSAINYIIGSGAHLATELTNNTQAQYYYAALNQYAPNMNALIIATAVLLFILVLALIALSVP
jgi:Cu/Ag efflux pump CusA